MTENARQQTLHEIVLPEGVGPVRCAGREILRRIFVTVRDGQWRETAPSWWKSEIDEARGTARLNARHVSDLVAFEWSGLLQVNDDMRHVSFEIFGRVLRDMEVCRLGLVVLHPVDAMVGSQVQTTGPDARGQHSVEQMIAPQPIVNGVPQAMTEPFSDLRVERLSFGRLELRLEGDLFELEDQRNWGDTSFKTYCTPLRVGFPRALTAGVTIAHRVEIRFLPAPESVPPLRPHAYKSTPDLQPAKFPRIGREFRAGAPGIRSLRDTSEPAWDHLHVDAQSNGDIGAVRAMLESAGPTRISIGIEAGEGPSSNLLDMFVTHRRMVSRLLLYGRGASLPTATVLDIWNQQLQAVGLLQELPVFIATRGYFVELNRGTTHSAITSGIAFPLTATVHSSDAATIRENVPAIGDMVDTLSRRPATGEIAVMPLALHFPRAASPYAFPREMVAPWLAATLIHAGLARVGSVTLAEDVLEVLTDTDQGRTLAADLTACANASVTPVEVKLPPYLHAGVFKADPNAGTKTLLANLGASPAKIDLTVGSVEVPAHGVVWVG